VPVRHGVALGGPIKGSVRGASIEDVCQQSVLISSR